MWGYLFIFNFFSEQTRVIEREKVKCCGYHFSSIFAVSRRVVWVINPTIAILGRVRKFSICIF